MEEKMYQVKEIMEMFGITRDTIKYYEKRGLIQPSREENGYRLFDAMNIEKLKKVLDLRDLGFSIDEVVELSNTTNYGKGFAMVTDLRKDTEEKVRELCRKLERIRAFESGFLDIQRFREGFNVERDYTICRECPLLTDEDKKTFFTRNVKVVYLNEDYLPERIEYRFGIKGNPDLKEECFNCRREKKIFQFVYRGLIEDEGEERLYQTLKQAFRDASLLGYELMREVYITKGLQMKGDAETIFLDIRIPIKERKFNA